MNIIVRMISE